MVIDPSNNSNIQNTTSGRTRQTIQTTRAGNEASAPVKPQANTGDSVSLSSAGQTMAKIEANLVKSPEVDEAKVAQLKAAIENNSYTIDEDNIANKLLEQDEMFR